MSARATPLYRRARAAPPPWAETTIAGWDADGFRRAEPFATKVVSKFSDALDVFSIVGTEHPDYAGLSWLDFLGTGKRMESNLALYQTNPGYYDATEEKRPAMIYKSLDGVHWRVAGNGNHRTCIARFAFHYQGKRVLRGLNTTRYAIDRDYLGLFAALQAAARGRVHVEAVPRKRGRDDGPDWMVETFDTAVLIDDGGKRRTLGRDDLAREIARLAPRPGPFKRLAARLRGS